MSRLVGLHDAAAMLGISTEELNELRSRSEIFGYRDGTTWKFRIEEIQRVARLRGIELADVDVPPVSLPPTTGEGSGLSIDAELDELVEVSELEGEEEDTDGPDSVLVSDEELGGSDPSASSTVIGTHQPGEDPGSDLLLSAAAVGEAEASDTAIQVGGDELEVDIEGGAHPTQVGPDSSAPPPDLAHGDGQGSFASVPGDSQVSVQPTSADSGSELRLAPESSILLSGGGSDVLAGGRPSSEDSGATGALAGDEDDIILDSEAEGDIDFGGQLDLSDDELERSVGSASEVSLEGSDLALAPSDTVVGGPDSDVTLNASESGINLGSPSDSGISLEQTPPEIIVDEPLELGEVDPFEKDDLLLEPADQLKADDDFLLTPVEADATEEADSGSQVIALDTEELGADAATLLEEGEAEGADFAEPLHEGRVVEGPAPLPGGVGLAAATEAPYSLWNVLGLGLVLLPLTLTGLMMIDLVRNIWSWNGTYELNSGLMNFILSMFGS
jgi:hypothetical protein